MMTGKSGEVPNEIITPGRAFVRVTPKHYLRLSEAVFEMDYVFIRTVLFRYHRRYNLLPSPYIRCP